MATSTGTTPSYPKSPVSWGLEFDEPVTRSWQEASLGFESKRQSKEPLSEEQQSFIQKHADRAAEAWILDRIEKQWREPGLYVVESKEAALASLDEAEVRMWRLHHRVQELEHNLAAWTQER